MNGNEREAAAAKVRAAEKKLQRAREDAAGVHGFAAAMRASAAVAFWEREHAAAVRLAAR